MLRRGAHDIFINESDDSAFQKFNKVRARTEASDAAILLPVRACPWTLAYARMRRRTRRGLPIKDANGPRPNFQCRPFPNLRGTLFTGTTP
eukprot:5423618-Pleurochrysis_carterae.AAC.2